MNKFELLIILFDICVIVGSLALGACFFEFIMASDMPNWLKWIFLK